MGMENLYLYFGINEHIGNHFSDNTFDLEGKHMNCGVFPEESLFLMHLKCLKVINST